MSAGPLSAPRPVLPVPRPTAGTAAVLAGATVLAQVAYPLVRGQALDVLTVATVVLFAAATTAAVVAARGARDALLLLGTAGGLGFAAEVVGVATGWPFGAYSYDGSLGPRLLAVPVVIPLAWAMMAWPALCVGRRLGHPVLGGAAALAAWDLFLDPQMVADGHWHWSGGGPRLLGIPVTNDLGWCAVALVVLTALHRALPARGEDDAVPLALWLWTWTSSVLANAVFFHRPAVALVGGLGMAVTGVPLLASLRRPATVAAAGPARP